MICDPASPRIYFIFIYYNIKVHVGVGVLTKIDSTEYVHCIYSTCTCRLCTCTCIYNVHVNVHVQHVHCVYTCVYAKTCKDYCIKLMQAITTLYDD